MKRFATAFILSTTLLTEPAFALGVSMNNLTRDLSFPDPVPEQVTKDNAQTGN